VSWKRLLLALLAAVPGSCFSLMMLTFSVDNAEIDPVTLLVFRLWFVVVPTSVILAFVFKWTSRGKHALFCARLPFCWPVVVLLVRVLVLHQTEKSALSAVDDKGIPHGSVDPTAPRGKMLSELKQQVIP
jgi:hypothetical protein